MPGRDTAVNNGRELEFAVINIAESLYLQTRRQVSVGKRIWGAERKIDVVLRDPDSRKSLGIECKFQGTGGTAEEKIPTTIEDINAWPIPGIVVIHGEGFSSNMRSYLYSTGKAVDLEDLKTWLELFFGL
jgi:hypothetical protein